MSAFESMTIADVVVVVKNSHIRQVAVSIHVGKLVPSFHLFNRNFKKYTDFNVMGHKSALRHINVSLFHLNVPKE